MFTDLEKTLSGLFVEKLPPLPDNLKSGSVKYLPWVLIIFGIIGLLSMISILGLFSTASVLALSRLAPMHLSAFDLLLMYILAPLQSLMIIVAGYWMLKQQLSGWRLALICTLLGFVIHILHFSLFGLVLDLLFTYLLFQIRESYIN